MDQTPIPLRIKRSNDSLSVEWRDGTSSIVEALILRKNCPCAGCREQRGDDVHSKPLTGKKRSLNVIQNSLEQETTIEHVWAVGSYAIGIKWQDGHDSGIFPFHLIRSLANTDR